MSLCTVSITGKDFKCEYKIERLHLNYCTGIFKQQIMDMNNFSFAFSSPKYDKKTYDLFFSEANKLSPFQDIQSDNQIPLLQLLNLCDDLQTPQTLKSNISSQVKLSGMVPLLYSLQKCASNSHQIEKSILDLFSKDEIDHLFQFDLSTERILRIIEKLMKKNLLSNKELFALIQKNNLNPLMICMEKDKIHEIILKDGKEEIFQTEMQYINPSSLNSNIKDKQKIAELQQIIESQAHIISDIQKQLESSVLTKDEFISSQQQMKILLNDSISSFSSQFNSLITSQNQQITNISNSVSTKISEVKENNKCDIENLRSTIASQIQEVNNISDITVEVLKKIYPVGSIYISYSNTNPNTLFGFGTWIQIIDRFLYCANSAGTTGGEETHALTIEEMPSHNHSIQLAWGPNDPFHGMNYGSHTEGRYSFPIGNAGGQSDGTTKPHNNMPPYITIFCWRRTD